MNRKAVFLDLDGTLFDNKAKSIPASTIKALKNIRGDVDLFLATGRSLFTLEPIAKILPYFKGLVLLNGQHVIFQGKTIHYHPIDACLIQKLYEVASKKEIPIAYVAEDKAYVYSYSEDVLKYFAQRSNQQFIECTKPMDQSISIAMGWLFTSDENIDWLQKEIPELSFIKWGKFGADIVMAGDSKKTGVERIIEVGGYSHEDTIAIGNGDNDIEMLKVVKTSVAMGNSPEWVKEKASLVTSSVHEDGIFNAFKKLGLLR